MQRERLMIVVDFENDFLTKESKKTIKQSYTLKKLKKDLKKIQKHAKKYATITLDSYETIVK